MTSDDKFFLFPDQFRIGKEVLVLREAGVALIAIRNVRDDEVGQNRKKKAVDLLAPNDENLLVDEREFIEFLGVVNGLNPIMMPGRIPGDDDVLPQGKGFADGVEGPTTHHDGMS